MKMKKKVYTCNTLVVGTGCAAFNGADSLYDEGVKDILIVTEGIQMGTSRNTGSDKQTYYKLSLSGSTEDSVYKMAENLYAGESVNGDTCLVEAALSTRCFFKLVNLGVPFPSDEYGQYVGYKTDHDPMQRATSCGPLTSKYMTECLEKSVRNKGIQIIDKTRIIQLLVTEENGEKRIYGAIGIDEEGLVVIYCENIIYATGGPSALYYNSVYPGSQTCAHGVAIASGACVSNATEWQYGIASTKYRWNLSGTYQQVIPRYISTEQDGSDEREFLMDYFNTPQEMLNAVFLKGYQWPFDPRKVEVGGSSIVDIAVYVEEQVKGRQVYLDYRNNPEVSTKDGKFDFTLLSDEANTYLRKSNALFGTPVQRLRYMNENAYHLFQSHGIDLQKDLLKISVCAQHNNGGLYADKWWQSNLKHLFPVGEVCGNFGVYRPGGTALNATQVGSLRAAQYIGQKYNNSPNVNLYQQLAKQQIEDVEKICTRILNRATDIKPMQERIKTQRKMDACAAFIRNQKKIKTLKDECYKQVNHFLDIVSAKTMSELKQAWITYDVFITQYVYLSTMEKYIDEGGLSRGSYLIQDVSDLTNIQQEGVKTKLDKGKRKEIIQVTQFVNDQIKISNIERRPLPKPDVWFETIYKQYQNKEIIGK